MQSYLIASSLGNDEETHDSSNSNEEEVDHRSGIISIRHMKQTKENGIGMPIPGLVLY